MLFQAGSLTVDIQLFGFDPDGKFIQSLMEDNAVFLKLNFFGRKLLKSPFIALLQQVERIDLIAAFGECLSGCKGF